VIAVPPQRRVDEGASAVEYAILVAAIAAVVIALVYALGTWVKGTYTDNCEGFNSAGVSSGSSCS
jgi:pilus assembly protein Flp/PilA